MKSSYSNIVNQNVAFPQSNFDLKDGALTFHDIELKHVLKKFGSPLRISYLPSIRAQIRKAKKLFNESIEKLEYKGEYYFCYCTKCCHISHMITTALQENVHLETSTSFDLDIIENLFKKELLSTHIHLIHNGYKTKEYLDKVAKLQSKGFVNSILVLDSENELKQIVNNPNIEKSKIGLRVAINEEANSNFYTSRQGIKQSRIIKYFKTHIKIESKVQLEMLHFYIHSGIADSAYYWEELQKIIDIYIELKKLCPSLKSLNLGGGFPFQNSLRFDYDYAAIAEQIIQRIKDACTHESVAVPNIYTEFGKYTVAESGALIFEVLEHKKQNESEDWYIVDNSIMNTIPDTRTSLEKFVLLPINKWDTKAIRVKVGGISCDQADYYDSYDLNQYVNLPLISNDQKEALYIGFFHTGAYQDALSGYGGIKHCLVPSPKHLIIDKDENGNMREFVYREEQTAEEVLRILDYI